MSLPFLPLSPLPSSPWPLSASYLFICLLALALPLLLLPATTLPCFFLFASPFLPISVCLLSLCLSICIPLCAPLVVFCVFLLLLTAHLSMFLSLPPSPLLPSPCLFFLSPNPLPLPSSFLSVFRSFLCHLSVFPPTISLPLSLGPSMSVCLSLPLPLLLASHCLFPGKVRVDSDAGAVP